jgi:hypothetical protein
MIFRNIIRLILLLVVLVRIADAQEIAPRDSAALLELIQKSLTDGDPAEIEKKLTVFLGRPSGITVPVVISLESYYRPDQMIRTKAFYADVLRVVGLFILEYPQAFPQGLPSLATLEHRERLGPLFEALTPYWHHNASLQKTLGPLDPLITPDLLDAARQADAWQWIHTVRGLRGEMQAMLSAYEKAGDDTGIIMLGELLGRYPELSHGMSPEAFKTKTLAQFFAAALGHGNAELDGIFPVILKLDEWEKIRPGLRQQVAELVSRPCVMAWCDVVKQFRAGQREEAVTLLNTLPTVHQEVLARYAGKIDMVQRLEKEDVRLRARVLQILLSSQDCPEEALSALARTMPINLLIETVKAMLRYNNSDPAEIWRGTLLLSALANREDKPENLQEVLRFHQSDIQRVKSLFSNAQQEDRAEVYGKAVEPFTR